MSVIILSAVALIYAFLAYDLIFKHVGDWKKISAFILAAIIIVLAFRHSMDSCYFIGNSTVLSCHH